MTSYNCYRVLLLAPKPCTNNIICKFYSFLWNQASALAMVLMPMGNAGNLSPSTMVQSSVASLYTLCLTCMAQLFRKFLLYLPISAASSFDRYLPHSCCTQKLTLGSFRSKSSNLILCSSQLSRKMRAFANFLTYYISGKLYTPYSHPSASILSLYLSLLNDISSLSTALYRRAFGAASIFLKRQDRNCEVMEASMAHLALAKQMGMQLLKPTSPAYYRQIQSTIQSVSPPASHSCRVICSQASQSALRGTSALKTASSCRRMHAFGARVKRGDMQSVSDMVEMLVCGMIWQGDAVLLPHAIDTLKWLLVRQLSDRLRIVVRCRQMSTVASCSLINIVIQPQQEGKMIRVGVVEDEWVQ